ncbi:hypothetical protein ACWDU0_00085 [Streptomyces cellulosae]|uniref:hypothetical protein n=1 Tax=Streptomyces TaxID=1883 RepID=UPI0003691CBC|nr:hypothetical protein [Streptomyces sp. McG7]MBT2906284.1 hypothetical protein [Streptomyces sp. McG8]MYQ32765.1 hypothetical protein [Streptomyces sp. SID4956]MYW50187.1 hypothetical protein [Streptomyces sp. SID8376]THC57913.1 hypothetical protein E7X38_07825 [Streptomyces sp. Akac8]UVT09422.1 hypothetical protein AY578_09000 [Streptomyces thermocarboxydus]
MAVTATEYGTSTDTAFFRDITEVFRKHPEAAEKYALASLALEKQLGIDYAQRHAVSRIEDGRIITEFHDRETGPQVIRASACIKWELRGQNLVCVDRHELEM